MSGHNFKPSFPSKRKRYRDDALSFANEVSNIPGSSNDSVDAVLYTDEICSIPGNSNEVQEIITTHPLQHSSLEITESTTDKANTHSGPSELSLDDSSHLDDQLVQFNSDSDFSVSSNSDSNLVPVNEEEDFNDPASLPSGIEKLQDWAVQHNITHVALDHLLKIIPRLSESNLPKDSRTLLKTPRTVNYVCLPGASTYYSYLGLEKVILKAISEGIECRLVNKMAYLTCKFNIDGLPISNSKSHQMWPILCQIKESKIQVPQVVALYTGVKKPDTEIWDIIFKPFIDEAKFIQENGIKIGDTTYFVSWKSSLFICDSPGRASIKLIKHHNSRFGCDYCQQEGQFNKCMNYETKVGILRNNNNFRAREQEEHHHGTSPLEALDIDMIQSFPPDYMHLICIGIVKKLLLMWTSGSIELKVRQHSRIINQISERLIEAGLCLPANFSRKHQSLNVCSRWKATELRTFILYTGPVVLKGLLPNPLYCHFLLLHLATFILISPELSRKFCDYAKYLIENFVEQSAVIYKKSFVVYNVHLLLHLPHFVNIIGNLDEFSCFPFENYLYTLKNILRSHYLPHQQVLKRLIENENKSSKISFFERRKLSLNLGKQCIIINNSEYFYCDSSKETENVGEIEVNGRQFSKFDNLYEVPTHSQRFGIIVGSGLSSAMHFRCTDFKRALCIPLVEGSFALFPFSHTC